MRANRGTAATATTSKTITSKTGNSATNYSPLDHHQQYKRRRGDTSQAGGVANSIHHNQNIQEQHENFMPPSSPIEFIDDQTQLNNQQHQQQHRQAYQAERPSSNDEDEEFNRASSRGVGPSSSVERLGRDQDSLILEEVYVCNCCGVSGELAPSVKFMSSFKCAFFLANFLVFAFGLANFGMGLWFRIDPKVYEIHKYIETQNFTIAGWLMLSCGFTACLMSLLGFVAAGRSAISLLVFYFSVIITLTIAFVGTLVLLTVYGLGSTLEHFITKEIYEQIRRRSMINDQDSFTTAHAIEFMDFIQVKMRCCGASDFRDYLKLGMSIPTTCYTIDKNYVSAPGCGHSLRELFDLRAGMGAGFTLGSIISQLLAVVLSSLIFCSIYHWRASPKSREIPMTTPDELLPPFNGVVDQQPRDTMVYRQHHTQQQVPRRASSALARRDSFRSVNNISSPHLQRPRSRTPIII